MAIFRYFWFICAAFMLVNIVRLRKRMPELVERGLLTESEAGALIRWTAVWIVGCPLVLGVIGVAANWSSPFCAGVLSFEDVPRALVSFIQLTAWLTFLLWLWRGNGGDLLARFGSGAARDHSTYRRYSPRAMRVGLTVLLIMSTAVAAVLWRVNPPPPELSCPALRPA